MVTFIFYFEVKNFTVTFVSQFLAYEACTTGFYSNGTGFSVFVGMQA